MTQNDKEIIYKNLLKNFTKDDLIYSITSILFMNPKSWLENDKNLVNSKENTLDMLIKYWESKEKYEICSKLLTIKQSI